MGDLMEVTLDPEIRKNPKKVGELIIQLAEDIELCKGNLSEIKDRGFFKKFFSNNTRDLADAMLKQNDTITLFLNIVQSLIVLNLNNTVVLAGIQDELTKHENGRGNFSNKYISMAKEYLSQSIESAKKVIDKLDRHEGDIEVVKNSLAFKENLDKEQTKLIEGLSKKFHAKEELDRIQSDKIINLENTLAQKKSIIKGQSDLLASLQSSLSSNDNLDKRQDNEISSLRKLVEENKATDENQQDLLIDLKIRVDKLESMLSLVQESLEKKNYTPHFMVCLVLVILSLGLSGMLMIK